MRTTHVNKSLPDELGEDIVVKSYKRGSPEAAMPIIDPKHSYLILSYLVPKSKLQWNFNRNPYIFI